MPCVLTIFPQSDGGMFATYLYIIESARCSVYMVQVEIRVYHMSCCNSHQIIPCIHHRLRQTMSILNCLENMLFLFSLIYDHLCFVVACFNVFLLKCFKI